MAPLTRDEKFQLRMTTEERQMLEALADKDGFSSSDEIRQLIRKEYSARFGDAQPKKQKR